MNKVEVNIIRLEHGSGLELPSYQTSQAAGMDLRAACQDDSPILINSGEWKLIPTGMIFEIPEGFEGQIRPRSGLAFKHGITCLNTPGTIDSDYRGEVKVLLINHGNIPFTVERNMRIAQMVIASVTQAVISEKEHTQTTERGTSGFGSTGIL